MLRNFSFRLRLPIYFFAFLFSTGCQKLQDYISLHGDADYKACNVKKVTSVFETDTTVYNFTYNNWGNPVTMTHDHVSTGRPNYSFVYDSKNRLAQFIKPYNNGKYEEWQQYEYNSKNQIVKAVVYDFGTLAGAIPLPSNFLAYLYFDYDSHGRIIHVKQENSIGNGLVNVTEKNYVYDANGNLVDGSVYDNKLNPNRTNAVWMFIARNYSINNPYTAAQYNKNNLPVHCPGTDIVLSGNDVFIDYMCR